MAVFFGRLVRTMQSAVGLRPKTAYGPPNTRGTGDPLTSSDAVRSAIMRPADPYKGPVPDALTRQSTLGAGIGLEPDELRRRSAPKRRGASYDLMG